MAATRKRAGNEEEAVSAVSSSIESKPVQTKNDAPKKVKVGDIVMYSHRRVAAGEDGKDYSEIPMMVTRVYNDRVTIAGVVFSDNMTFCAHGAKVVDNAPFGLGGGKWQFLR